MVFSKFKNFQFTIPTFLFNTYCNINKELKCEF